ncbi:hypothetical protein GCM10009347_01550 [Shewanella algicola]|uniref:Uncharacterized protein n=1 Tax=Shewanella algicola TaxID=640633 RepID=A0A9X1Z2J1_9GAMM|nr:hypothetical protein [Shewanella algicola]MCL1103743.1 hypothetical protein [Shewanella algicola]GGP37277.1 hypothetical protein GCM10009347_01550 [Shewanella algicola]
MTQYISSITKDMMLNSITPTHISLHSGDPSESGLNNEISSTHYTRQPCVFNQSLNGERVLNANVDITLSQGDSVNYIGYWNNSTFLMSESIQPILFTAVGVLTINQLSTVLKI